MWPVYVASSLLLFGVKLTCFEAALSPCHPSSQHSLSIATSDLKPAVEKVRSAVNIHCCEPVGDATLSKADSPIPHTSETIITNKRRRAYEKKFDGTSPRKRRGRSDKDVVKQICTSCSPSDESSDLDKGSYSITPLARAGSPFPVYQAANVCSDRRLEKLQQLCVAKYKRRRVSLYLLALVLALRSFLEDLAMVINKLEEETVRNDQLIFEYSSYVKSHNELAPLFLSLSKAEEHHTSTSR